MGRLKNVLKNSLRREAVFDLELFRYVVRGRVQGGRCWW
jgi:hypothetical protein